MHRTTAAALLAMAACTCFAADRSRAVRADFQRTHPCPSTGRSSGPCPGYQVDHRIALCAGGADRAGNLQWLSLEAHRRKTRQDIAECRQSGR